MNTNMLYLIVVDCSIKYCVGGDVKHYSINQLNLF